MAFCPACDWAHCCGNFGHARRARIFLWRDEAARAVRRLGNKRENRAQHHHDSAEPDPFHQRQQIGVNCWPAAFRASSCVHYVEIAERRGLNRDHGFCDSAGEE